MDVTEDEKGKRGVEIAAMWWPIKPTGQFSYDDCSGIDAWLDGEPIQIKYDGLSNETGNVLHEIYEKDPGHPEQPWRGLGQKAKWYIWVNEEWALKVSMDSLAQKEVGRTLRSTNNGGTSLGFLIPATELTQMPGSQVHWHGVGGLEDTRSEDDK